MCVLCATLVVLVLHQSIERTNCSIIWQISNPPIVFGQDVVLSCNASLAENCCTNTATWMRGFDVIVHHGASKNYSKYIQEQYSGVFLLIIKNFAEDDINQQYTCLYDFSSFSEVLRINQNNFKYKPNEDEIKANINTTSDEVIFAIVIFEKVYPQPKCVLVVTQETENSNNTNVTVEEEVLTGHFYKIELHLVCEILNNKCMDSVAVLCTIGNDEMVVRNESFLTCPDINDFSWSANKSSDHKILLVFIISGLAMCATFTVCVLMWKKSQCSRRTINSCIEGSVANSTCSEKWCLTYWIRADDSNGEETEQTPLLESYSDTTCNDRCNTTNVENQTGVSYTSNKSTTISAQKNKDVTNIVYHCIKHDPSYIQKLLTNIKINTASLWKYVRRLKAFRHLPGIPIKEGQSMTIQFNGPAQKEKDVIHMVTYAKIYDKDYVEKLVSDTLINNARQQKPILKPKSCPSVSALPSTKVSDVDVLKKSSRIPTWGVRKRSRMSVTSKQKPSNE